MPRLNTRSRKSIFKLRRSVTPVVVSPVSTPSLLSEDVEEAQVVSPTPSCNDINVADQTCDYSLDRFPDVSNWESDLYPTDHDDVQYRGCTSSLTSSNVMRVSFNSIDEDSVDDKPLRVGLTRTKSVRSGLSSLALKSNENIPSAKSVADHDPNDQRNDCPWGFFVDNSHASKRMLHLIAPEDRFRSATSPYFIPRKLARPISKSTVEYRLQGLKL